MKKSVTVVLIFILLSVGLLYLFRAFSMSDSRSSNFNQNQYSLTDSTSIWVVVNKQHPLIPKTYSPKKLVAIGNGQRMHPQAANELAKMLKEAEISKHQLTVESGYRSYETQSLAYDSLVTGFGQAKADNESARAGYSEHQTGLAIDFGSEGCKVQDCFANTSTGKWLRSNSYKYGFILRYPPNKESITGYKNEAWHYRYVGHGLAEQLHSGNNITLEEFFGVSGGKRYL